MYSGCGNSLQYRIRRSEMSADELDDCKFEETDFAKFREELMKRLDEGRRQLDEGEYVEFDEVGLQKFFDGLIERATRNQK
jgi:hypothetical protein